MVTTDNNQLLAAGFLQVDNEPVVECSGIAGRRSGIKNITGNNDGIHRILVNGFQQPANKCLMLRLSALPMKCWPRCQSEVWRMRMY